MLSTFPDPPVLTPYNATTPPPLPAKFHAVALVTGFTDDQLVVADVWYDWSVQSMRVTLYGLEGGYADALYTPKGVYLLDSVNGQDPKQCFGPAPSPDQVPAPNWLTNYGVQ